jgi:hydrogenase nickel incorporation protein HypB
MCTTCGCQETEGLLGKNSEKSHHHIHQNSIALEKSILDVNEKYAKSNRKILKDKNNLALNFVSSPGSGKTSLLVRTIKDLSASFPISVIEGDQYTELDAERIREAGAQAHQINTGKACHLDAHMVGHAFEHLMLKNDGFVFIENVGNLICPALFDLGENHRVALISVTEGAEKPLKYPDMFSGSDIIVINKIDLLDYVDFNLDQFKDYVRRINPKAKLFLVSAKTGQGLDLWYNWLKSIQLCKQSA